MRAATVTFHGEKPGIQALPGQDGNLVVNLGIPKYEENEQPYVSLDPYSPPEVDDELRITDGVLVKIDDPDYKTGFLGYMISADKVAQTGGMLLRVCTSDRPNSSVSTVGSQKGKIQVPGKGYEDLSDRGNTSWGDVLHTLQPGQVLEMVKRGSEKGSHHGTVLVNVGNRLLPFTKSQYRNLSRNRSEARRYIKRIIDDDGRISPNAREWKVEAALDLLVSEPKLLHLYND